MRGRTRRAEALLVVLALGSAPALAASLNLDEGPIVLGRTESVGVTIQIDEPPGTENRPLRLSVNVGSFQEVTRKGPGTYRTVYVPPATRFPQVALVAAWRETGPDAPIEFLRIPLYGMTKIDVSARAGASVKVEAGLAEFGPVPVGKKGSATIPITVPPEIPEANIVVKEKSGLVARSKAVVDVPAYNRLTVALVPHAVVATGSDWARLEVLYDLGGQAVSADRIKVSASLGQVQFQRAEKGRYVYRFTPPLGTPAREVDFSVTVAGDTAARGAAKLKLGLPPAERVVVNPPPHAIFSDGKSTAPVSVLVFDETGLGLPGQNVEVLANGVTLSEVQYKGDGLYQAKLLAPATHPAGGLVQLAARVKRPDGTLRTGTANYQVQPSPVPKSVTADISPSPVLANGKGRATVSLDVRDGSGLPLRGAHLIVMADEGSLGQLSEVGAGRYQAEYVGPGQVPEAGAATVRVVDASGGFESRLSIPLREGPAVLLGVRGGYTHSLQDLSMPRAGLELWVPVRLGHSFFGFGLTATAGTASQKVTSGDATSTTTATLVPVALRLGYEAYATRRLTLTVGAGALASWVRVQNDANRVRVSTLGAGGLGFLCAGLWLGPGQLFADLSYGYAPLEHRDFRLNAGGATFEAGYRFGLR